MQFNAVVSIPMCKEQHICVAIVTILNAFSIFICTGDVMNLYPSSVRGKTYPPPPTKIIFAKAIRNGHKFNNTKFKYPKFVFYALFRKCVPL